MLIREARGTPARVFARFGTLLYMLNLGYAIDNPIMHMSSIFAFPCLINASPRCSPVIHNTLERGVERHVELDNLPEAEVTSKVASLLSS